MSRSKPTITKPGDGALTVLTPRRFPPPWTVEEQEACFAVRDADGQQLAYEPGRESATGIAHAGRGKFIVIPAIP
jgi:hypothetical protein